MKSSHRRRPVTILLEEPELRACQWFKKNVSRGTKKGVDYTALIVNLAPLFALSHPKEFLAWFDRAVWYERHEGVDAYKYMVAAVAKHPAYKRVRLPV